MTRQVLAITLSATLLSAHHSIEKEFDRDKQIDYRAAVTTVTWQNPHVVFKAMVAGADGKTSEWVFEMSSPSSLPRQGFKKDSLLPGQIVTVKAFPARDGSNKGTTVKITWPGGKAFEDKGAWANWMSAPEAQAKGFSIVAK